MTTSYYPHEDDWYSGEWVYEEEWQAAGRPLPFDLIAIGAVLVVVAGLVVGLGRLSPARATAPVASSPAQPARQSPEEAVPAAPPLALGGPQAFVMPYDEYALTQGPHGMSYGHYAIDLAAGHGEPVLSPINGRVADYFLDGIGNTTLVIENDAYVVTMLHGIYTVDVGQEVRIGDQVGTESNQGNTRDMAGNSCRNRDCGYHTHLNVYDKRAGQNVNPLDLLPRPHAS
jgi:murein DD-endopeptidase MepM/ murein hydrolase activator NlpD